MRQMPSPEEFLLRQPLYRRFSPDEGRIDALRDFVEPLDVYCPSCKSVSVFNRSDQTPSQARAGMVYTGGGGMPLIPAKPSPYVFDMSFACSRDDDHMLRFWFRVDETAIQKIGEFPSMMDRLSPEARKYETILGTSTLQDYRAASLLHSHGFAVGAFLYLRRVLERVVESVAARTHSGDQGWTYAEWRKDKRMQEILADLAPKLPDFLAENKQLYAILSKGVHDLEEEECHEAFQPVRAAIDEILEDELAKRAKAARREGLRKELQQLKTRQSGN